MSARLRTTSGAVAIQRSLLPTIIDAQTSFASTISTKATVTSSAITYQPNAFQGLSVIQTHQLAAFSEGLRQLAALQATGWKQAAVPQLLRIPTLTLSSGAAIYRFPGSVFTLSPAALAQLAADAVALQSACNSILTSAQTLANLAQNANSTVQQDWTALLPLVQQIQTLAGTLQTPSGTQAEWTQMQGLVQQANALLLDMQYQSQLAATAASNATQLNNAPAGCNNLAAIDTAIAQAQASATAATNTYNGTIWSAIVVQGAASYVEPPTIPPPTIPITAACLTGTFLTALGVPYEFDLKINEACTQSLLAAMSGACGTPSLSGFVTNFIKIVQGVMAATAGAGGAIGAVLGAVVTAAIASFTVECMLLQAVIKEADTNGNGITMHFSLVPLGIGASILAPFGLAAPLFAPAIAELIAGTEEGTLAAEAFVPGGTGNAAVDVFWITGN